MLLGRGDVRATVAGIVASVTLCSVALVPLVHAQGGLAAFVASLDSSAAAFAAEDSSNAWGSVARTDGSSLVARILGRGPALWTEVGLGVLVIPAAVVGLGRLGADRSAAGTQLGI